MTALLVVDPVPPPARAVNDIPERPAVPLPCQEPGFLRVITEAYPDLTYITFRTPGEVLHAWLDRAGGGYVVLTMRADGRHGVREVGGPWYDRLSRLAGMWHAMTVPTGGR